MKLPKRALTDVDLKRYTKHIPFFRGVFMRDQIPDKPKEKECAIINLDSNDGNGTHWVAYKKNGNAVHYFDSFGNLKPPMDLVRYFGVKNKIFYNHKIFQKYNTYNCGHLCIEFLINKEYG